MEEIRTVDAYIEPIKVNGFIEDYKMYLAYNGVEPCYLYGCPEFAKFASYFKRKMGASTKGMTFTDYYGIRSSFNDFESVLYTVTGSDNLMRAINYIEDTCENLDIQSDLTIYLNGKEYPVVREVDGEEYKARDYFKYSKKGHNNKVYVDLAAEVYALKDNKKDSIIEQIEQKQKRR